MARIRSRQRKKAATTRPSHCRSRALCERLLNGRAGGLGARRTGGRYRVITLGHGQDAGEQRNRIAFESVGVPGPIVALVVVQHGG